MRNQSWQAQLLELFRDPLLQDEMVEVARNTCAGGAGLTAAVISCAAYLENPLTGLPALRACMQRVASLQPSDPDWFGELAAPMVSGAECLEFPPGFGYVDQEQAQRIAEVGRQLSTAPRAWLLRRIVACPDSRLRLGPLNLTGLSALVLQAHGRTVDQAERWFLWWRMEPVLAQAQRAQRAGLSAVPFLTHQMTYTGERPPLRSLDLDDLLKGVGLE